MTKKSALFSSLTSLGIAIDEITAILSGNKLVTKDHIITLIKHLRKTADVLEDLLK